MKQAPQGLLKAKEFGWSMSGLKARTYPESDFFRNR